MKPHRLLLISAACVLLASTGISRADDAAVSNAKADEAAPPSRETPADPAPTVSANSVDRTPQTSAPSTPPTREEMPTISPAALASLAANYAPPPSAGSDEVAKANQAEAAAVRRMRDAMAALEATSAATSTAVPEFDFAQAGANDDQAMASARAQLENVRKMIEALMASMPASPSGATLASAPAQAVKDERETKKDDDDEATKAAEAELAEAQALANAAVPAVAAAASSSGSALAGSVARSSQKKSTHHSMEALTHPDLGPDNSDGKHHEMGELF